MLKGGIGRWGGTPDSGQVRDILGPSAELKKKRKKMATPTHPDDKIRIIRCYALQKVRSASRGNASTILIVVLALKILVWLLQNRVWKMVGRGQADARVRKRPPKVAKDEEISARPKSQNPSNAGKLLGIALLGVGVASAILHFNVVPSSFGPSHRVQVPFSASRVMENGSSFTPELTASRLWGSYRLAKKKKKNWLEDAVCTSINVKKISSHFFTDLKCTLDYDHDCLSKWLLSKIG